MSLISVVRDVMDSNGWPQPIVGVAGSQDQNMRQSLALINKTLTSVSYKKDWPVLLREHSFDTVVGQDTYPLPPDYHHLVANTAWNASQYYKLKGSMTGAMWYRYVHDGYGRKHFDGFRLDRHAQDFKLTPVPDAVETLVFMYVTKNLVVDVDGNPKERYEQDTDVSLVEEFLVETGLTWRWREKKGLDFTAELAEHDSAVRTRFAQFSALGDINVGACPYDYPPLTNGYIGPGPIGG